MARPSESFPISTNFQFSVEQRRRLEELANTEGVKMANIVRRAIDARYDHSILGQQRCADAQACRCPQFFAPLSPAASVPTVADPKA